MGISIQSVEVRNDGELSGAFKIVTKEKFQGLIMLQYAFARVHVNRIMDFAKSNNLPAMYPDSEFVDTGGLISYGIDRNAFIRRQAFFIDRILKGAKPIEMAVELPTKFELVVNLKTARLLGLKISQTILLRADRVIE